MKKVCNIYLPSSKRGMKIFMFFLVSLYTLYFILYTPPVFAATSISASGTGTSVVITDTNVKDGDIVSFKNGKYELSHTAYDPDVLGVVSDNPSVSVIDTTLDKSRLVVSSGKVYVLVTRKNGAIKNGDPITTSDTKGVGEKATKSGFIIGAAMEDFNDTGTGKILVQLHPEFSTNQNANNATIKENLLTTLQLGAAAAALSPLGALRFILAAAIAIISFVLGFLFFGRISSRGVEAVGRNPLASKKIMTSVVLNVLITVVIIGAGVAIAYIILVL